MKIPLQGKVYIPVIDWKNEYFVHNQHGEYVHNFATFEDAKEYIKIFPCPENYTISFLSANETFRKIQE
jgi:hypothetical protein